MRFYRNEAETRADNAKRQGHRAAIAELRHVAVEDGARMAADAIHPEFRGFSFPPSSQPLG